MHIGEYYTALKKKEILPFATTWMNLENFILNEKKSVDEGQILRGSTYMGLIKHACIGEGNDNPLQYSCLENPRDRGTWWAAIYGVTQSWTGLK